MNKFVSKIDPKTGKKFRGLVGLAAEEIAAKEAERALVVAASEAVAIDPLQNPLTPIQFSAMVKFIKAQTSQDMDAMIRAAIVSVAGGDAESLAAFVAIAEYEKSGQYRYDHPLSVGVAKLMEMSAEQRSVWWLQAANA